MSRKKKSISLALKVLIGALSFWIIWSRLRYEFTPAAMELIRQSALSPAGIFLLLTSICLAPLNWGLEAIKWRIITRPIQDVSLALASRSVYSGVFMGNLAPGRAMEFLARVIYFDRPHRGKVTVLFFVGGLFQLSITLLVGFVALLFRFSQVGSEPGKMLAGTIVAGALLLALLIYCILRIEKILSLISKRISREQHQGPFTYRFTKKVLARLFAFSALRYLVFYTQLLLILLLLQPGTPSFALFCGIALYFMLTSTIPMISIIEPAIRAAIALVVFRDTGISSAGMALSAVLIWIVNIVLPSIAGYFFLLKQNFNFRSMTGK